MFAHGEEPVLFQTSEGKSSYIPSSFQHSCFFSSFRSCVRQKKTRSKGGKEQIPVLDHLLSLIRLPANKDSTYLSHSWAALVVLPHIRWENKLWVILKEILSMLSSTCVSHSLLFPEKSHWMQLWTFLFFSLLGQTSWEREGDTSRHMLHRVTLCECWRREFCKRSVTIPICSLLSFLAHPK